MTDQPWIVGEGFPAAIAQLFEAGDVVINQNGLFIYDGTPAPGNPPIISDSDSNEDQFGNPVVPGSITYTYGTSPPLAQGTNGASLVWYYWNGTQWVLMIETTIGDAGSPSVQLGIDVGGGGISISDSSLQVLSAADTNLYDTQRLTLWNTAPVTIDSTSPQTLVSAPVAAGTYEISGVVVMVADGTGTPNFRMLTTGGAAALFQMESSLDGGTAGGYTEDGYTLGTLAQCGPALVNGDGYLLHVRGLVTFTGTPGTMELQMGATASVATCTIPIAGALFQLEPVNGSAGGGGGGGSATGIPWLIYPSGDTTGITDAAAAMAKIATYGVCWLANGHFYFETGTVVLGPQEYLKGMGRWNTMVFGVGTGDVIRQYNSTYGGGGLWGGGVKDLTIDGIHATAPVNLLHLGDIAQYQFGVAVQNATGGGCWGVLFDNTIWWTEQYQGTIWARNCDSHIGFNVSDTADTSTNSFGYGTLDCIIEAQEGQDGVVIQNGAYPYHGRLTIRGNFQGSDSAPVSNAVLRIIGTVPAGHPGAGDGSAIYGMDDLSILAETGDYTYQPYTIYFGEAATNFIKGCRGTMDFTQGAGAFTPSNLIIQSNAATFWFDGPVIGDANLQPAATFPVPSMTAPMIYSKNFLSGANGNTFADSGDFFKATLSADITIDMAPSGQGGTIPGPQRKTFILIQPASGGPWTWTFPQPATPTTTNPAVYWPGGVQPTPSAGAGAVDVVELRTYDGASWYGTADLDVS